jgi:hypothetical protein
MPTQTYTDNSRAKVVNIIPKRTIRHAHNLNALKTEKKNEQTTYKTHQNTKNIIPPQNCLPPQIFDVLSGICLCWHNRAKYVGNDNDRYFLVLIL